MLNKKSTINKKIVFLKKILLPSKVNIFYRITNEKIYILLILYTW